MTRIYMRGPRLVLPWLIFFIGCVPCPVLGQNAWSNLTLDRDAQVILPQGNTLWVGTWGGVLQWVQGTEKYRKFTVADGLANNEVHDLAVDKQGRLWAGTAQGLSVFNGTAWTSYDRHNSGIPGEMVSKVAVTPDGQVWMHSRGVNGSLGMGLTVFNGTDWFTYTQANSGLADDDIRALAVDLNGHVWIGTWNGDVSRFAGDSWTTFSNININRNQIYALTVDTLNRLWVVSYISPVFMFDGQAWQAFAPENGCNVLLRDVAAGASGVVWFATLAGVCSFDGTTWTRYDTSNSQIETDAVWTVAAQGSKWWAGYELLGPGVTEFSGGSWRQYVPVDVLPENIGTVGLGVIDLPRAETWFDADPGAVVIDKDGWRSYGPSNSELKGTCLTRIVKGLNGHLWFAGGNCAGGLAEYDPIGKVWTQHAGSGLPDTFVYAVAPGDNGWIWAGSRKGLSFNNGASWLTYDTSNSDLPNNLVTTIAVDGLGHIWTGCTTRFDLGTGWTTYANVETAIQTRYHEIKDTFYEDRRCWLADSAKRVWTSDPATGGVKYYNGTSWTAFTQTDMGHPLPYGWVASLAGKDQSGALWVIIKDFNNTRGLLSRFDGAAWKAFAPSDGFIDPPGNLTVDHLGRTWISGFRGYSLYYNRYQPTSLAVSPSGGGKFTSMDGALALTFPSGAFSSNVLARLVPIKNLAEGELAPVGNQFKLEAEVEGTGTPVTTVNQPYTLTYQYSGNETWTVKEDTLALYWWNGGEWVREPSGSVDTATKRVSAATSHLGLFSIWGEAAPPPPANDYYPLYLPLLSKPSE